MAKIAVLAQKRPFLDPKKDQKGQKITFSLVLYFLHSLAKFKQKIAKKSKNMAKKGDFVTKKGHFWTQKKDQKGQYRLFAQTSLFTHFSQI